MYRLSGRDVNQAAYAHRHQVAIVAHLSLGSEMTLTDLPPLTDGTINFVDSGIRRRCNLTFETQTPSRRFLRMLDDDETKYSVYLGIDTLQPMGVYYLRDLAIDDTGESRNYRLSLQDESAVMAERKTARARVYNGDVVSVVESILRDTGRSLTFTGETSLGITLQNYLVDFGKDPVATCEQLLESYGYEVLMDLVGNCVIRQIPGEPSNAMTTSIDPIILHQQIVQARRRTNHIIVTSTPLDGGQVRGEIFDMNPDSPTFAFGRYGDVPETFTVNGLRSDAECERVAERISYRLFQREATHTYSIIQIPKLDLGDGYTARGMRYTADRLAFSVVAARPMYVTGRGVTVNV
jgi:hypothetical protein